MGKQELHPTVEAFKQFMNRHPKLVKDIRKNGESWQDYYEKWVLFGEDDPLWNQYKKEKTESKTNQVKQHELLKQLTKLMDYIDFNKVQQQVNQLNEAINMVQKLLQQANQGDQSSSSQKGRERPFHLFRD